MGFLRKLFARIDQSGPCWIWLGGRHAKGYGQCHIGKKLIRVHRLMWEIYNGPIPGELLVLHKCDNPPCCNPEHLYLGTHSRNLQDAYDRKRFPSRAGIKHPLAKLTEADVLLIRRMAATLSYWEISKVLNIKPITVYHIVKRNRWKHI